MAQQVAADLQDNGEYTMVELVAQKGGWSTIRLEDGTEQKLRNSRIAMGEDGAPVEPLTDEDDDEATQGGDVFPSHIRAMYQMGTTEEGAKYIDCGDRLAQDLRGASLQEVAAMAAKVVQEPKLTQQGWLDLYTVDREAAGKNALNPGMVRMNIGNRIRGALAKAAKEAEEAAAAAA